MTLEDELEILLSRIGHLNGITLHIESTLLDYVKNYKRNAKNRDFGINGFIFGYRLILTDLTGPTDNGWLISKPTDANYNIHINELEDAIGKIIKNEAGDSITQAYEAFSTFLRDIIAAFFLQIPEYAVELNVIDSKELENVNWKMVIRKYNPVANNKKLFKLLKKIIPNLTAAEISNNRGINISDWYKALSFFRHKRTHSQGKFSKTDKDFYKLTKNQIHVLKENFPFESREDIFIFNLSRQNSHSNLILLAEYASLIVKEMNQVIYYYRKVNQRT